MNNELDWNIIKDDKRFQRLVNDLFAFETSLLQYIPSSPDIGADSGFDGYINAPIPFLSLSGKTSIQAKYIDVSEKPQTVRNRMKAYLLGGSGKQGEIQKAIDNNCENLILATNGLLSIPYKTELGNLKPNNLKNLIIFDQEELRNRIIQYPFLCKYYFNEKLSPTFVPSKIYFDVLEPHLNTTNLQSISSFNEVYNLLGNFLKDKVKKIVYFHAPGGFGKSHILNQISLGNVLDTDNRKVLIVDPNQPSFESAIREEITETVGQRYLLIFDDVDRSTESLPSLLKIINSTSNIDLKIVITSRSASKYIIENMISTLLLESKTTELQLPKWEEKDLLALVKEKNATVSDEKARYIVRTYQNPYIISWIAKRLNGGDVDPIALHNKLVEQLKDEALHVSKGLGLTDNQIIDFLFNFLLSLPVSRTDTSVLPKLGEITGINVTQIKDLLERFESTGVIRVVGDKYRIMPDLKGDLLLQHLINTSGKSKAENLLEYWFSDYPENILFNIHSASRYGELRSINEWISRLVKNMRVEITTKQQFSSRLNKLISYLADYLPVEVGELIADIAKLSKALGITTDDIGPLLQSLIFHRNTTKLAVEIFLNNYAGIKEGTYSNYKLEAIARDFLNPLFHNYEKLDEVLDIYLDKTKENDDLITKLILLSIREILAGEHELDESYGTSITLGWRTLKKNKRIIEIREKALNIIKIALKNQSDTIFTEIIETIEKIGESMHVNYKESPMWGVIQKNREDVLTFFDGSKIQSLNSLNKIVFDDFLLKWWAREWPAENDIVSLIKLVKRDNSYLCLKLLKDRSPAFIEWNDFIKYKPAEKNKIRDSRWSWYIAMQFDDSYSKHISEELARRLLIEYKTATELSNFLHEIGQFLDGNDWKPPIFLHFIMVQTPSVLKEIRERYWNLIHEKFRPYIESELVEYNIHNLEIFTLDYNQNFKTKTYIEVDNLLRLHISKTGDEAFGTINRYIKTNNILPTSLFYNAIWVYYRITKNTEKTILLLTTQLEIDIRKKTLLKLRSLDYIEYILSEIKKDSPQFQPQGKLKVQLTFLLKRFPLPDYHFNKILQITANSIDELIIILDYRMTLEDRSMIIRYPRSFIDINYLSVKQKISWLFDKTKSWIKIFLFDPYSTLFDRSYLKKFDSINAYHGGEMEVKVTSSKDFYNLITFLFDKDQKGYRGLYDSKDVVENFIADDIPNSDSLTIKVLLELIEKLQFKKTLFLLRLIKLDQLSPKQFAEIIDMLFEKSGKDSTFEQEMKSMLFNKAITGGFSSAVGEIPIQLTNKKNFFIEVKNICRFDFNKNACNEMVKEIDSHIASHLKHDEEFLNERS